MSVISVIRSVSRVRSIDLAYVEAMNNTQTSKHVESILRSTALWADLQKKNQNLFGLYFIQKTSNKNAVAIIII